MRKNANSDNDLKQHKKKTKQNEKRRMKKRVTRGMESKVKQDETENSRLCIQNRINIITNEEEKEEAKNVFLIHIKQHSRKRFTTRERWSRMRPYNANNKKNNKKVSKRTS